MRILLIAASLLLPATAFAFNPTLKNEDSRSYKYEVKCGGSTTHSSIGSNTSTSLTSGSCTLTVVGAGSAQLRADLRCVIKGGSLSCN